MKVSPELPDSSTMARLRSMKLLPLCPTVIMAVVRPVMPVVAQGPTIQVVVAVQTPAAAVPVPKVGLAVPLCSLRAMVVNPFSQAQTWAVVAAPGTLTMCILPTEVLVVDSFFCERARERGLDY